LTETIIKATHLIWGHRDDGGQREDERVYVPEEGDKYRKSAGWTCVGLAKAIHTYVHTVYIQYFEQGNHHTYGHIRCVYMVMANPKVLTNPVTGVMRRAKHMRSLERQGRQEGTK